MLPVYKIFFEDDSTFEGYFYPDTKWELIPNKNIFKIEYYFLDKKIVLEKFLRYNIRYELTHIVIGQFQGKVISKIIIEGTDKEFTTQYIIDLVKKSINRYIKEKEKEWNGKSVTGWKSGIEHHNGKDNIYQIKRGINEKR